MMKKLFTITLLISIQFCSFTVMASPPHTHIIFIGDSHSIGSFGEEIDHWLRKRTDTSFDFIASGGSAPTQWINGKFITSCAYEDHSTNTKAPIRNVCLKNFLTPTLSNVIKTSITDPKIKNEEKIVLIAHGANYGFAEQQYAPQLANTVTLIKQAYSAGYRCIWIGPPHMKRFEGARLDQDYRIISEAIAKAAKETKNAEPCTLIDSRAISSYPASSNPKKHPDGIHYDFPGTVYFEGKRAAQEWALKVIHLLP